MKIRTSFVSNSSSTSFTFLFKGDSLEDIYTLIKKYDQYFDLWDEDYGFSDEKKMVHITSNEVIGAMQSIENRLEVVDIQTIVDEIDSSIKDLSKWMKDAESKGKFDNYYFNDIMDQTMLKSRVEGAAKSGFTHALVVGFGDNHGDIQGGDVGTTMDYEGRNININKPDLILTTEQNR